MLLLLLGIFILLCVAGLFLYYHTYYEGLGGGLIAIGIILAVFTAIPLVGISIGVSNLKVIDEQIALYTEENANIENNIAELVENYQEFERGIVSEVSPDDAMTLVTLYPDLKSDDMVSAQIELHMKNHEKLMELKEQKIAGAVMRWWLYFGGNKEE